MNHEGLYSPARIKERLRRRLDPSVPPSRTADVFVENTLIMAKRHEANAINDIERKREKKTSALLSLSQTPPLPPRGPTYSHDVRWVDDRTDRSLTSLFPCLM